MTTELKVGDFKATAVGGIYGGGHEVKLSELAGSTLVLYFYPENDTPGCTIQACDCAIPGVNSNPMWNFSA
jgi:thioredoxin-dependent peroxiredoxin